MIWVMRCLLIGWGLTSLLSIFFAWLSIESLHKSPHVRTGKE